MSKAHLIAPAIPQAAAHTVRLGQTAQRFSDKEENKFVKLTAESRYELCAVGDPIEGIVLSVENATSAGYSIGSIYASGRMFATADGLQATPGVGAIAVGDYVVCGTVVARGTDLVGFAKVCKATDQPGAVPAALANVGPQMKNGLFGWRVVSLGTVGTGAVGTSIVVERANA